MTGDLRTPLDYGALPDAPHAETVGGLMILLDRLQGQLLAGGAVLILPHGFLPGVTHVHGTPVVRAGVDVPMVAVPGGRAGL